MKNRELIKLLMDLDMDAEIHILGDIEVMGVYLSGETKLNERDIGESPGIVSFTADLTKAKGEVVELDTKPEAEPEAKTNGKGKTPSKERLADVVEKAKKDNPKEASPGF